MPPRRASAAGLVFALLVLATVAAFAWSQRLKRDPLVLDRVTFGVKGRPFEPSGGCGARSERIKFRVTTTDQATVQVIRPGGNARLHPGLRPLPAPLQLLRLPLGRPRPHRRLRIPRPLQAAGQAAGSGTRPRPARDDPPALRRHRLQASREGRALSGILAGAGVLARRRRRRDRDPQSPGTAALGGDARSDRPRPGPHPRRPVALPPDSRPPRPPHPPRRLRHRRARGNSGPRRCLPPLANHPAAGRLSPPSPSASPSNREANPPTS